MAAIETSSPQERPRVAVIGGGISGLSAAHRLGTDFPVTVFEAGQRLGGHSSTAIVDTAVGEQPIDMGFIVFNDRNYPNFTALLDQIGAEHVASNMSFSVSDLEGKYEYAGSSPNALYATRRNLLRPAFHGMVRDLVRFNNDAKRLIAENDVDDEISLRNFLDAGGYSKEFIEKLIVPQVSAVWSADPAQLDSFPARIVFEFFNNHGILELRGRPKWQTIKGGSAAYVAKLRAATNAEFHTGTAVEAVRRGEHGVAIKLSDGAEAIFDEVIFATHSDQALDLLVDPTDSEREVLGAIPYQQNDVVLHTDESLLPRRRAARASWNYHLLERPRDRTTVTYWMNNLQPIAGDQNYMVTLNLTDKIDRASVIKHQSFSHPVFTREGLAAQRRHAEISGVNRTHFCGAYWRWGFHEDGAWSGLRVARMIAEAPRGESMVVAA
jgi:predicted NAD/FAD-binding protein